MAIVGGVVVVALAIILVVIPLLMGVYACSEAEVLGQKWKFCPEKPPALLSASASISESNFHDNSIRPPPPPSNDTSVIEEANELTEANSTSASNGTSLNSIVGDWNFTGQAFKDLAKMSGTIKFEENKEFSSRFYLNGFLQPVKYGDYVYSPSEGTLTITYFGNNPTTYKIDKMTEDSFNTNSTMESIFYLKNK
jgi:hypothetical protein